MQAGAGTASELTPCTTAATPACRLRLRATQWGRARQAPSTWKNGPGKDRDSLLGVKPDHHHVHPPVPLPAPHLMELLLGAPVCPGQAPASVLSGMGLTGGFSPPVSPEPALCFSHKTTPADGTGRGRSWPLGAPQALRAGFSPPLSLSPACSLQRCSPTRHPPAPLSQEHPSCWSGSRSSRADWTDLPPDLPCPTAPAP